MCGSNNYDNPQVLVDGFFQQMHPMTQYEKGTTVSCLPGKGEGCA